MCRRRAAQTPSAPTVPNPWTWMTSGRILAISSMVLSKCRPLATRVGMLGTFTDGNRISRRPSRPKCGLGPFARGATTTTLWPASSRLPSSCCTANISPLLPGP